MPYTITIGAGDNAQEVELSDEQVADIVKIHSKSPKKPAQPQDSAPEDAGSLVKTLQALLPKPKPGKSGDAPELSASEIANIQEQIGALAQTVHDYIKGEESAKRKSRSSKAEKRAQELLDSGRIAAGELEAVTAQLERDYDTISAIYDRIPAQKGGKSDEAKSDRAKSDAGKGSGTPVFTREQIAKMTPTEFLKLEADIMKAHEAGNIQ